MEEEEKKKKEIAFYTATVTAWYTTKFEKDKYLLTLSSAGIGLLVTLVTTVGLKTPYTALMYALAVVSFLVCILVILAIFDRNAKHLENIIQKDEEKDPALRAYDKIASFSFVFGIVFILLVGVFSGIENFKQKEPMMTDKSKKVVDTSKHMKKSVEGASGLRPQKNDDSQSNNSKSKKE